MARYAVTTTGGKVLKVVNADSPEAALHYVARVMRMPQHRLEARMATTTEDVTRQIGIVLLILAIVMLLAWAAMAWSGELS